MYGNANATQASAKTAFPSANAPPCEVAGRCQPTLDGLIKDVVSFVQNINECKAQAATVRERLCGSWPVDPSDKNERHINGQLDALEQFQGDAWRALYDLRNHLSAIQSALG